MNVIISFGTYLAEEGDFLYFISKTRLSYGISRRHRWTVFDNLVIFFFLLFCFSFSNFSKT